MTQGALVFLSQESNDASRTIHLPTTKSDGAVESSSSKSQPQSQSQSQLTRAKATRKTPLHHSIWTGLCSATRELSPFGAGLAILKSEDSSDKALAERPERPR